MTTDPVIQVAPAPYVTLKMAEVITGLTVKAMQRKIEEGKWVLGREYRYSPDGGVFLSIEGYKKWVESGQGSKRAKRASVSRSCSSPGKSPSRSG